MRRRLQQTPQPDDGIGASEVSRLLGIGRSQVYATPRVMRLAFYPLGPRKPRWRRAVIERYIAETAATPAAAKVA